MTVSEYAALRGISVQSAKSYCKKGLIPCREVDGKYIVTKNVRPPYLCRKKKKRSARDQYKDILLALSQNRHVSAELLCCDETLFAAYFGELHKNGYIAKGRGGEDRPRNFYITPKGLDYLSRLQDKKTKLSVQLPLCEEES
ncbi:MAG: YjcQ family protein [Clostridiales bacterium]|nr:YjcQ family protein [Clostridiales bacterium]